MGEKNFDLSGVKVHIGIPAYKEIPPQTVVSIVNTCLSLVGQGVVFNLVIKPGCCYVDQVRCLIADEFLRTPATHLFMIDSDMVWDGDQFLRVLAHATKMDCVAAVYRLKQEVEAYPVSVIDGTKVNEYDCVEATGMGLGFCCVQRHVIDRLAELSPKLRMNNSDYPVPAIYQCDQAGDMYRGEDISFFDRMRLAGYKSFVDLGVDLGHIGVKEYRGSFIKMLEIYWSQ